MLRYLKYLLPMLFALSATAQNLVPNGSFEENYQEPNSIGSIDYCKHWFNATLCDADYFSTISGSPSSDIPLNAWGYQNAYDGNHYAGIYIYHKTFSYALDYAETKLTTPLLSKRYCVSFYVSLADSASGYTVNNIGAYFSQDSVYNNDCIRLTQFNPQIINSSSNPLANKLTWTKVSGTFLAQGGEQYLILGNFNLPENDDTAFVGSSGNNWNNYYGYMYIDSVSVTLCDAVGVEETTLIKPSIYPNPASNFVSISLPLNQINSQLSIYNLTGQLVAQKPITSAQIPIAELGNGMYIFVITADDNKVLSRQRVVVSR